MCLLGWYQACIGIPGTCRKSHLMLDEGMTLHGRICVQRDSRMALLLRPSSVRLRERVPEFDLRLPDDPPATTWLAWAIGCCASSFHRRWGTSQAKYYICSQTGRNPPFWTA